MKKVDNKQFVWAEKYRPQTLDDVIIPKGIRDKFASYIKDGRFPHILLSSNTPGTGKSSIVRAIIGDLEADVMWINGSGEAGIDVIRNRVKDFVSSISIDDSPKIVVIDEADGLKGDAQKNLRGFIEEFSKDSTFILTCNYKEQLIEPLRNRLIHFDFDSLYNQNKKELATQIFDRLQFILTNEGVNFNKSELGPVITNMYPSVRSMVLVLQQSIIDSTEGRKLSLDDNMVNLNSQYATILGSIKTKEFTSIRKMLQELDDPGSLYTYIFKNLDLWFEAESIPQVVLLCAKYQDMHANARDKAICTAAFAVELMMTPSIKFL